MLENKSYILENGKLVRTIVDSGIIYPLTEEGIKRELVGNTRWYVETDVCDALTLDKDILEPYRVEPIGQPGIDPEDYISETGLILCNLHEKSLNVFQQLLLAEITRL